MKNENIINNLISLLNDKIESKEIHFERVYEASDETLTEYWGYKKVKSSIGNNISVTNILKAFQGFPEAFNISDEDGLTALMISTIYKNYEMMEMLLSHGADSNKIKWNNNLSEDRTALDYAIANNDEKAIEILSRYKAKTANKIIHEMYNGEDMKNKNIAQHLVELLDQSILNLQKIVFDNTNSYNYFSDEDLAYHFKLYDEYRALRFSIKVDQTQDNILKAFQGFPEAFGVSDRYDFTALIACTIQKEYEMMEILLSYGANPNHSRFDHKHQNICTALDYAIANNDEKAIEILSRYKAKTASQPRLKAA